MIGDVMIAVDPHKASNTAAVLDPVTKTVVEVARSANSVQWRFSVRPRGHWLCLRCKA